MPWVGRICAFASESVDLKMQEDNLLVEQTAFASRGPVTLDQFATPRVHSSQNRKTADLDNSATHQKVLEYFPGVQFLT